MTAAAISRSLRWVVALSLLAVGIAGGQTPAEPPSSGTTADALASLGWLEGCWSGKVAQREFTERWSKAAGGAMTGTSRMVAAGAPVSNEQLRLEARAGDVYYVIAPSGQTEETFRFVGRTVDKIGDRADELYTFENPAQDFPQRIVYRHTAGGGLFAEVEGKVNGAERKVIYPMHKVECGTP